MEKATIQQKSRDFAIRIINCYKYLTEEKKEFVMSKQLLRCGTSIGANTRESKNAQSRTDFLSKLSIALKEADETAYWLCTMTLDPSVKVRGQENAYREVIKTAVGGAAGVIHQVDSPVTDCQPNDNVEAMRVWMLGNRKNKKQ